MAGAVVPGAMKTVGITVAFEMSLLISVMVTPPAGAPTGKLTLNGTD
jgi:mannitol-specific phosphotransferase system IIBC component